MNRENDLNKLKRYWNDLTLAEQVAFQADLDKLDWDLVDRARALIGGAKVDSSSASFAPHPVTKRPEYLARRAELEAKGLEALAKGKVAAVLLAGGQGSRLGFDKPKGCFNMGTQGDLPIFKCLIRNMEAVNARFDGPKVPLCVMTSSLNDADTRAFFKENDYFGYPVDRVFFFEQAEAPALSLDGEVLLEEKGKISYAPNGNGGWFSSMQKAGLIERLSALGVEWLNVFAVDNVLQYIADPGFLGLCLAEGSLCGAKVIAKASPEERVGALCLRNGRSSVVEYSEMSPEMAYQKNPDGSYAYYYGVTLNYLFNIAHLCSVGDANLPLHLAKKKIKALGEVPEEPNAYKIETFIFDILEAFPKVSALEIIREEEFAPIKNKEGNDSPETARALLKNVHPDWKEI